jgi:TonB family protein
MARRYQKPGAASFVGSLVLHGAILAGFWASTVLAPAPQFYESFAIEIFSPPPTIEAAEMIPGSAPEELVVERPTEEPPQVEPPAPEPEAPPAPRPEPPKPAQADRPTTPPPPNPDSARRDQPSAGPGAVASSPGGENINIRMEGLRRDYPEYYNTIVFQINRCFSRNAANGRWVAVVSFVIMRDGSVTDLRLAQRSPNQAFNVQAMEAVECAGQRGRIGPLPSDMPFDRLPIQFTFEPSRPGP